MRATSEFGHLFSPKVSRISIAMKVLLLLFSVLCSTVALSLDDDWIQWKVSVAVERMTYGDLSIVKVVSI